MASHIRAGTPPERPGRHLRQRAPRRWKPVPYQRPEARQRFRSMAERRWRMQRGLEWALGERFGRAPGAHFREDYEKLVAAGVLDPERWYPRPRSTEADTRCLRCGHGWRRRYRRKSDVRRCPRCKSVYWNLPRRPG